MSDSDHISPRVNAARLPDFIGKEVRLVGRVTNSESSRMTLEASDGGEVVIINTVNANNSDDYVEVVGRVQNATTIQMHACISMGNDLDLKLVNDTIELIHDPRYFSKIFS